MRLVLIRSDPGKATSTVYSCASKQLLIFAPPALLTLHLKRFTQNGSALRKVQRHVEFKTLFDMAKYCSAAAAGIGSISVDQKQVLYSLYGVIEVLLIITSTFLSLTMILQFSN